MTSKRVYLLMLGLIVVLVLAVFGSAYGIQSLLSSKSQQLVALKAQVAGLQNQQKTLVQAKKDVATYTPLYNISKVVVPENKDQAETVRQIVKLAGANGIKIGSITFPNSTLGGTGTGSAVTPKAAGVTGATGNPALSQLIAVPNIPGVYVLQISIISDTNAPVSYPQLISFLQALEQNRLTAQVSSVTITPAPNSLGKFTFILNVNSYIKP